MSNKSGAAPKAVVDIQNRARGGEELTRFWITIAVKKKRRLILIMFWSLESRSCGCPWIHVNHIIIGREVAEHIIVSASKIHNKILMKSNHFSLTLESSRWAAGSWQVDSLQKRCHQVLGAPSNATDPKPTSTCSRLHCRSSHHHCSESAWAHLLRNRTPKTAKSPKERAQTSPLRQLHARLPTSVSANPPKQARCTT